MAKQLELSPEEVVEYVRSEVDALKDNPRMEIWREVCCTNPGFTKKVDMRGGFTAINPQYQLMEATKLWGPYGSTWGIRDTQFTFRGDEKPSIMLVAEFWYPGGSFPIAVDMPWKANDDCCKKLLTEARSKSLALLGFNADIFLGKWEDSRYVADMHTKFGDQDELRTKALKSIRLAESEEGLAKCRDRIDSLFTETAINKTMHNELMEEIDKQRMSLVNEGKI